MSIDNVLELLRGRIPCKIIFAALPWGLGHLSRSIPLIKLLQDAGCEVVLMATMEQQNFIKNHGLKLRYELAKPFPIQFTGRGLGVGYLVRNSFAWMRYAYQMRQLAKNYAQRHGVELIISDNIPSFRLKDTYSIYITHQTNIRYRISALVEKLINRLHRKLMQGFDQVWIPDFPPSKSLAGDLSKNNVANAHYIGWLSRFKSKELNKRVYDYEILCLLSGPEPQRTLFQNILLAQLSKTDLKWVLIQGIVGKKTEDPQYMGEGKIVANANSQILEILLESSRIVICRSGYSSLMDLRTLGLGAILVPTPGQDEQQSLADYLHLKHGFFAVSQAHFDLTTARLQYLEYIDNFVQSN